jgi:hypothetical protein
MGACIMQPMIFSKVAINECILANSYAYEPWHGRMFDEIAARTQPGNGWPPGTTVCGNSCMRFTAKVFYAIM